MSKKLKNVNFNTKRFFIAAKLAQLETLEKLESNCELVASVCDFIHQLQRERGVSNVYIASKGKHFSQRRIKQIEQTLKTQNKLQKTLERNYGNSSHNRDGYRLLTVIGLALKGIEELDGLRDKIQNQQIKTFDLTQAFCRLINRLLDIIFEAADIASDPDITKILVALFNFIQGKEYAGQERAWGAIGFAKTHFNKKICYRLAHLQKAQNGSFEVFANYVDNSTSIKWDAFQGNKCNKELEQLRNMIKGLADGSLIDSEISEVWYDIATNRIDNMHSIEVELTRILKTAAREKVEQASKELKQGEQVLDDALSEDANSSSFTLLFDTNTTGLLADVELEQPEGLEQMTTNTDTSTNSLVVDHKSFYDLLKSQSTHIDKMKVELEQAKQALLDQKIVSRAKLMIMQEMQINENQAYQKLQKAAMNKNTTILKIANSIISTVS